MPRRATRAQERRRLLADAAFVHVPLYSDVIVVGGGAAGLVAAIAAAESGASVVVVEQDLSCGRSILATGGGRCNFANARLDPARFNEPAFVEDVCGPAWLDDVLAFFWDCGLRWCEEDGRLYPLSRQSASVRNVLVARARAAGVVLAPAREVVGVSFIAEDPQDASWVDDADNHAHYDPRTSATPPVGLAEVALVESFDDVGAYVLPGARAVVLATGGAAFPSLVDLGIATKRRRGVLCPLACEPSPLSALDGRRVHAELRLVRGGQTRPLWRERGEVLLRAYGLSGIVTLNASRRAEPGDLIELDLVPDLSLAELAGIVDPRDTGAFVPGALDGVVDPEIARVLERLATERWGTGVRLGAGEYGGVAGGEGRTAEALASLAKALPFRVTGLAETDHAQATRGGIPVGRVDRETLALRGHPWLLACGEALDVDADCGGFNLAWAWKSGMVAGTAAARWALS